MRVTFNANFNGGTNGFILIKLYRDGEQVGNTIKLNSSTHQKSRNLASGLYLVSIKVLATPAGTNFSIDLPTTPATPNTFNAGPHFKAYSLYIN